VCGYKVRDKDTEGRYFKIKSAPKGLEHVYTSF